jgi:hypothetical protein
MGAALPSEANSSLNSRVHINPVPKNPLPINENSFGYGAFFEKQVNDLQFYEPAIPQFISRAIDFRVLWGDGYPQVSNQGSLGACTAFAVVGAMECASRQFTRIPIWELDPLFLYGQTIKCGNIQCRDVGATVLDAVKASTHGVSQKLPGIKSTWNEPPSQMQLSSAMSHRVLKFGRIKQDLQTFRTLLSQQIAIVFALAISADANSWMHSTERQRPSHVFPTPWGNQDINTVMGAHAVVIVGFSDVGRLFTVRNSWGKTWGSEGHFYISYETLLTPLWCRDFYAVLEIS